MATKNGTAFNKSEAIRQALAQHPDKTPAEIARLLTKQHKVTFRPKAVSSIKAKVRNKQQLAGTSTATTGALAESGSVAEMVTNLQAYIRRLGKADLHRLI